MVTPLSGHQLPVLPARLSGLCGTVMERGLTAHLQAQAQSFLHKAQLLDGTAGRCVSEQPLHL